MALRRRDWTDLLLQIIDFYVIATGVEQLIWNDITFSYIVCINVLYIPLIVFLKLTRKAGRSNISILLMQFMEIITYSVCIIGILHFYVSDSFNRNVYVSSAICFAMAVYITDRRLKKPDIEGEHIPKLIIAVPTVMYIYSSWQEINSVRIMWLALFVVTFVLLINYHFEDRLCRILFSDEYDDGFPYRQADLTVSLVKDCICVTTFAILLIILVPLMKFSGNLRADIRKSNTAVYDTFYEEYEITDNSVDKGKETINYEASDNITGDEEVVIASGKTDGKKIHFNKYAKYTAVVAAAVLAVIVVAVSVMKRLIALKGSYIFKQDLYEDIIQVNSEEKSGGQPETTQEKAGGEAVMNNEIIERIRENISRVIVGKENVIDYYLTALLAQGHILVEDVPGTGKTKLSKAFAISTGMDFQRIQFTADMLPADITGLRFYNSKEADFRIRKGPIFSNIVLADEINRATPKAQSALLECMEECQVTIDGNSFMLEKPFMVVATQNQIETVGTFVLPEAQLDRFMLKINMGYPSSDDELEIINKYYNSDPLDELEPVCTRQDIINMINKAGLVTTDDEIRRYVVKLVNETRNNSNIAIGASPRATLALLSAAKANAYIKGKTSCSIDDVKNIAVPVLAHRIKLKPKNLIGQLSGEEVINNIVWN
uniref:AAA family ATPase n=1 Tax=Lachnospira eligens TaxID=39485 RepID=UPI00402A4718